MKIFYYSTTVNSLYVAKQFNARLYSIPKLLKEKKLTFEDDIVGFVFPCYYFNAPRIVKEFIKNANIRLS